MDENQYGMSDLRQYLSGRPIYQPQPTLPPPDLLSSHRGLTLNQPNPYDMLVFHSDSTNNNTPSGFTGFEIETGTSGLNSTTVDTGTGRWPRQETLTLLEIRSKLDPKFKEANQKGPLWDEVSRIMSEEHGYQRNGKKCREKFENLYKYYKKTKEGKAGRQDGKHYRFFRQLEALYGDTNVNSSASASETHHQLVGNNFNFNFPNNIQESSFPTNKLSDTSLSLSNFSESDTTSSDDFDQSCDNNDLRKKKRKSKRGWKNKIKDFIDVQMRKLMDKQEAWMDKMMRTIEHKEQERMLREEEWRKHDAERIEREHKFWASERAWIEARDASLMDALGKLTGKGHQIQNLNDDGSDQTMNNTTKVIWPEGEITRLIQLRSGMELKFQQSGLAEEVLWEEISTKMACCGYDRSALMCKEKWDSVNNYLMKCNKKRKENSKYNYHQNQEDHNYCETSTERGGDNIVDHTIRLNVHGSSPPNSNNNMGSNSISDNCFKYFMGDHY